jgi:hypothetical protein
MEDNRMKLFKILNVSVALGMVFMLPSTAHAQSAEQHARDMNDIAATAQAPNGSDSRFRPYSEPSYQYDVRPTKPGSLAVAYHVDTGSTWASAANKNSDDAKKRVLAACNAATGGGCYIAATVDGPGKVFLAEDAMGQTWIKQEVRKYGEPYTYDYRITDPARIDCQAKSFGCSMMGEYYSEYIYLDLDPSIDQVADYFPKGKLHWNRWAMVARPTTASGAAGQGKSWLVSGKQNSAATRKEILDRCQAESGVPCEISAYAVNDSEVLTGGASSASGLLVHFVDGRGKNRWTSAVSTKPKQKKYKKLMRDDPDPVEARDPATVKERIDRICPPSTCRVIATYDAATPRMQVIEDVK